MTTTTNPNAAAGGNSSNSSSSGASSAAKGTKVIKRYANRKLYDTERSCYVTLEEISQMIKDGDDVKVVDNKTKDDLTAVTLAQIIVEEEKKVQKMPLKLLRSIIQSGNEAIGELITDRVTNPVQRLREDVERRVDSLLKRDGKADAEAPVAAAAAAAPAGADGVDAKDGVVKEFVHSTTEAFETWQKRIDERVRETIGKMTPPLHRPDIDALKARIEALEARIREVESRKK